MTPVIPYPISSFDPRQVKGGGLMSGRMKALLVALGALGFAAMNGSLPWGP
jgi:hypothetical protein